MPFPQRGGIMRTLRIGLCQINTTVGDIEGNTRKILDYIKKGKKMAADLLVFPEMAVTGYPPEDLLLMPKFIEANLKAVDRIARATTSITAVVGFVHKDRDIFMRLPFSIMESWLMSIANLPPQLRRFRREPIFSARRKFHPDPWVNADRPEHL
jgi:predicted amidohydrolase